MDVNMPVMDGYEATRQIRSLAAPACDVKIMAMTASVTQNESDKRIKSGMDDFISKPFRPEDLFAKIAGLMMNSQ
jgi:CheY-like chemotaxis protein